MRFVFTALALASLALPVLAQQNRFNELVGRWTSLQEGYEIRIERDGSVFAQSSDFPLSGAAGRCITAGANFCFEGTFEGRPFTCAYAIAFLDGNRAVNYRVTRDSFVRCPVGIFHRSN